MDELKKPVKTVYFPNCQQLYISLSNDWTNSNFATLRNIGITTLNEMIPRVIKNDDIVIFQNRSMSNTLKALMSRCLSKH